jgi:tripartite-type tricarboxylate transporter receptor subunit TctC
MKLPYRRQFLHLAASAAALPAVSRIARAQTYPSRPVRIVAPTAPGGAPDILARLIGPWLSGRLGQQFVVENRPGGGFNIGTEAVVRAPPDGYTLLMVATVNAINATLYDRLNFDFLRDIAPVAGIIRQPLGWWCIRRFRPRRSLSSSPMPRPIRARSTWDHPATVPSRMFSANGSR